MNKEKYCPCCGREIKTEFRKKEEIRENIGRLLNFDSRFLEGDKKALLKLEEAIKFALEKKHDEK